MSVGYVAVQWNRNKVRYDLVVAGCVLVYLVVFFAVTFLLVEAPPSPEIAAIRALGSLAFLMLTTALAIGPAARIDRRLLPLLYNRRHLGVATFLVALAHGVLATVWYHAFGVLNPLTSLLVSDAGLAPGEFPFQAFGLCALLVLFVLAATSHDFWNRNLGPSLWKAIHMSLYAGYLFVVIHVAFGAMAAGYSAFETYLVLASALLLSVLHGAAAWRERRVDRAARTGSWIDVGSWRDIPDGRATIVPLEGGDRVAVFRYDGSKLAAVANACRHQNGPLGEGRVIDGCITCPWHGFQYRPEDGASPPPFTEKVATYRLRLDGDRILLDPTPLPPGTPRPIVEVTP